METISVGGRKYTDPDIISLVRATGRLIDPRSAVVHQARQLNEEYKSLSGEVVDPFQRLKILASLRGLQVLEMDRARASTERRDAILVPTSDGKRGQIVYNPSRQSGRVAFSIAHEIAHTFFPNSVRGARFRTMCDPESREANELERLCDLAASEILMPLEEFRVTLDGDFGLHVVNRVARVFGSSYESTVFRMATAHTGLAAAGLLRYRFRRAEERATKTDTLQRRLFGEVGRGLATRPCPKYRRQSFYMSPQCSDEHTIRFNKSFDLTSCVYEAGRSGGIHRSLEVLPNAASTSGVIEAIRAPYQREDADPDQRDVLFLWWSDS